MSMHILVPNIIVPMDSNIPLTDFSEYSPISTYNTGAEVTVAQDLKNYKCAADEISDATPKDNPTIWKPSTINRMAMFDLTSSKSTEHPDTIEFSFNNVISDTIAFIGIEANSITIDIYEQDGVTQIADTAVYSLVREEVPSFANFVLKKPRYKKKKVISLPKVFNSIVKVKIQMQGSIAKCRYCFFGTQEPLGLALWEGELGFDAIGSMERDYWGDLSLNEESASSYDTLSISVIEEFKNIDLVKEDLREQLHKAVLFIAGDGSIESLTIFGVYRGFRSPINPRKTIYKLNLESLAWKQ